MTPPKKKTSTPKTTTKKATSTVKKDVDAVEKKVDTTMDKIATKLDGKISKETKAKARNIMNKADTVAEEVDEFVGHVDELAESIFPHSEGSQAEFSAEWAEDVSRLFIFRFLWLIIQYFVIVVWGIRISIISGMHWIYMLLFGKRERNLRNRQVRFARHIIKWKAYMSGLTDERPDMITPKQK